MKSYREILEIIKQQINAIYDSSEAENIAWRLMEFIIKKNKLEIIVNKEMVSDVQETEFSKAIIQLQNNIPIQYITGTEYFYGLSFKVNNAVLIPRPETEELVDLIIKENTLDNLSLIDIGTGSGCIPISIFSKRKSWQISAIDISKNALAIASENAKIHHAKIELIETDILIHKSNLAPKFHIIVSNPPYILFSEKKDMRNNVLQHEPSEALFVTNNDPLQFYKAIIQFAVKTLLPTGKLYFECNEQFAEEVILLLQENNFTKCRLVRDLQNKKRMAFGQQQ